MAAPLVVPFNFQPVSTQKGTTGTYTVPAGKYAFVTLDMDHASVYSFSLGSGSPSVTDLNSDMSVMSKTLSLRLDSGQTIVMANSISNGSDSVSWSGSPIIKYAQANSSITTTITIDGTTWKTVVSKSSMSATLNSGTSTTSISITGSGTIGWFAEEFNEIT